VYFGQSVACAGDVNGDGFADVLIGAPYYGWDDLGRAYVYMGSAAGLPASPDWFADGSQEGAQFGISLATAGDVNADGYDDVIVGTFQSREAFVFLGSPAGLSSLPSWSAVGDSNDESFGATVSGAGDVDGDGYDDVIVGAPARSIGGKGRAFVFLGSTTGLSTSPAWVVEADQTDSGFGGGVANAGDVDGDGYDDVLVGAAGYSHGELHEGRVFVFLGSPAGLSTVAAWTAESDQAESGFGACATTNDVNGDGFADVVVGAFLYDVSRPDQGRAFLYLGSAGGLGTSPAWTADGEQMGESFGQSVAGAGDVDGDGFADVIIGAPLHSGAEPGVGRALVYLGSPGGLASAPAWEAEGEMEYEFFGYAVSTAGDVNGDGRRDVLVGSPYHWPNEAGRAFVDTDLACNGIGTSYCSANPNSTGSRAQISAWCSSSASEGVLLLEASPVPDQFGIFFHGRTQWQAPFGNGYLCVRHDIVRGTTSQASDHLASYLYDNSDDAHSLAAYVGSTRNFQYWFRDPVGGGAAFNTSDAVSLAILP
jgi:hypothetical protein